MNIEHPECSSNGSESQLDRRAVSFECDTALKTASMHPSNCITHLKLELVTVLRYLAASMNSFKSFRYIRGIKICPNLKKTPIPSSLICVTFQNCSAIEEACHRKMTIGRAFVPSLLHSLTFLNKILPIGSFNFDTAFYPMKPVMPSSRLWNLPNNEALDEVLEVAVKASRRAGDIILGNAGGSEVAERKANSRDLLTLIDPMCEKIIKDTILETFPHHVFLGEEDVAPGKEASSAALDGKLALASDEYGWLWIVDPIDGTTNFVHGMPLCMPSVAATYNGEVLVGVIYDCHRKELFTSIKGRGAFMNSERIMVGSQESIGDAVVAMGSPPAYESMQMSLKGVAALMPKVRTIRMLGSAALMLAWVANGRLTAYWEYDLSSWDIAAGALMIMEAGGRFTDLEGNGFNLRMRKICCSNGKVHAELLRVLRDEAFIV